MPCFAAGLPRVMDGADDNLSRDTAGLAGIMQSARDVTRVFSELSKRGELGKYAAYLIGDFVRKSQRVTVIAPVKATLTEGECQRGCAREGRRVAWNRGPLQQLHLFAADLAPLCHPGFPARRASSPLPVA